MLIGNVFLKPEFNIASMFCNFQCTVGSTPETVTKINQIVRADRRKSIRIISEAVNTDKETVRKILHEELHMKKVCAKLVPKKPDS
jgi:hypothetical protein